MEDTLPVVDANVDHSGRSSPESPDSDAVNTSSARVYFGPLQSAEKERAQRVNLGQPTPVKRSTRHSSIAALQVQDSGRNLAGNVAAGQESNMSSRSETPAVGEDLFEEPSSVLATRVLHAWDNPSPPPTPPSELAATSASTSELDNDILAPINNDSDVIDNATVVNILPQRFDEERSPNETSRNQAVTAESLPVEEDLIIFDSFSSPSVAPRLQATRATPPGPSHGTVDDLLSLSPGPLLAEPTLPATVTPGENEVAHIIASVPRESTPSIADEAEVAFTLSTDPDVFTSPPTTPSAEPIPQSELNADIPLVVLSATPEPEPQTPPLRRSTRPRRSVSPFVLPLTSTPAKSTTAANSPATVTPGPSSTRKRKAKIKEPEIAKLPDLVTVATNPAVALATPPPPTCAIDVLLEELHNNITAHVTPQGGSNVASSELLSSVPEEPVAARKPASHRLASLSPTSHDVLRQLLPPSDGPIDTTAVDSTSTPARVAERLLAQPSTVPGDEHTATYPEIPVQSPLPSTPTKSSAPSRVVEVMRTPARRVALNEAIAQGSLSPEKARTLMASARPTGSIFGAAGASSTPRSSHDPPRSPAKRVLIQDAPHSPHKGKTPIRPPADGLVRSNSADVIPAPALFPKTQRSASAEPPKLRVPMLRKPASADDTLRSSDALKPLPFPIVSRLPPTIVEVDERTPTPPPQPVPAKPPSSLRQPSAKAESKIPRPGSKPYARPTPSSTSISRVPAPSATKKVDSAALTGTTVVQARPMRMVRRVSAKPVTVDSSSDTDTVQPVAGPGPRTLAHRSATVRSTAQNPIVSTLKRKRDPLESKASPPNVKPVVLLRKVVRPAAAAKSSTVKSPSPARKPSPSRGRGATNGTAQARILMRKVVDTRKPKEPAAASQRAPSSEPEVKETRIPRPSSVFSVKSPDRQSNIVEVMSSPIAGDGEHSVPADQELPAAETTETPSGEAPVSTSAASRDTASVSEEPPESEPNGLRRTSRRRKSAQPTSDVFGPVTSTRQSQPRYKSVLPPDNTAFSGMSALALKTLTATNTARNQKQVSELQLEVILKEGKRPDSPTTKVKTTLDKQKEEKALQRQERAARRARKAAKAGEGDDSDAAGDDLDASFMSMDENRVQPTKHVRGAGEDEDYETPERPERPLKRGRFEEGGSGDDAGLSNGEDRLEKRVKWDRGLAKTFFLTGTPPNPRRPPKEELTKKGCLATKAKTIRLDTMGNVLNAEIPVPDIIPESIVVQKFVYEDDPEAQPEPSSPAKATRSKTKKKT